MTKSLGQVAYEALFVCREPDAKDEQRDRWWPALSPKDKTAWQAAAEAVADEYGALLRREIFDVREKHGEALLELDRWRAVIEAAKAFYVERQEPDSGHSIEELTFWQAVRALQEVEDGL